MSEDFVPRRFREKIKEAKEKQLTVLDLSSNHFSNYKKSKLIHIPSEVFELEHLESLDLSGNSIKEIPKQINNLKRLKSLNISNNCLHGIPESISKLKYLVLLDLNTNKIKNIPESITELPNLSKLILGVNYLEFIPEFIIKLTNLEQLILNGNQIRFIPEFIIKLTNLEQLILSGNQIRFVPKCLTEMINLTELGLSNNRLNNLPRSIGNLTNLCRLYLNFNQLNNLPKSITELTKLEQFGLSGNQLNITLEFITCFSRLTHIGLSYFQLKSLPEAITRLTRLTYLDLRNNQLTTLPKSITKLTRLTYLDLRNNQLTTLPESITKLTKLTHLDLSNNPIETPPREITNKGIKSIRKYFQQLEKEGSDYLYEAKLLIVGEGGAGKTTLAKKIQNPEYQLQDEDYTQGIDVIRWDFPMHNGQNFRINIWDFGGQEIYHATHQFFLTKRSLYTLVADTRKEDTDFYYWLNVVELLSDNSPLLIIKNEKQDRTREINERALRGEFTNFKETLATNLATKRGLPEVLTTIKHYITTLDHIGSKLPKTWTKVRETLEQDGRNYISQNEYFQTCQANGFNQRENQLQLSGYLHDLGVFLHFQEDALLKKTVILKPEWGTAAVYKVLDNATVRRKLGEFTKNDLANIWSAEQYIDMQDELLQLMMRFKLCYQILGTQSTYIAPQLLTENQPEYDWDYRNNLILRYTYEFMPKGILTQFIVTMHKFIDEQEYVWKSGVILHKEETKAEVIENYGKREIKIRVAGKYKRKIMTQVTYELDKIHGSYHRLKYSKLIPCNCKKCNGTQNPHFYSLNKLEDRIANRKKTIECDNYPYLEVEVFSLIDDVIDFSQPQVRDDFEFVSNPPTETNIHIHNHMNNQNKSGDNINQNGNTMGVGVNQGEIKAQNVAGNIHQTTSTSTDSSQDTKQSNSGNLGKIIIAIGTFLVTVFLGLYSGIFTPEGRKFLNLDQPEVPSETINESK